MKWKHLKHIGEHMPRWFDNAHLSRVRSVCAAVKRRTGADAWVDVRWAELCFGYVHPIDGDVRLPFSCKLFKNQARTVACRFDPLTDDYAEDDIVRFLNYAKAPEHLKESWRKAHETTRENERKSVQERDVGEATERAFENMEKAYDRHKMGRHYRGRAFVNGTKE